MTSDSFTSISPLTNSTTATGTTALGVGYLVVGIAVMSTNGVVIFVIVKTRDLHLPTLWLITIMAVNDFFMGCLLLLFHAPSALLGRYAYSDSVMPVSLYLQIFIPGQTCFNISMVILDRYIAVGWPLLYPRIVTTRRVLFVIIGSVILGIGRVAVLNLSAEDVFFEKNLAFVRPKQAVSPEVKKLRTFGLMFIPVFCLSTIVFSLCRIFKLIRRRRRATSPGGVSDDGAKFPMMAATSVGIFCLAYIPLIISIVMLIQEVKGYFVVVVARCGELAVYSVSFWNVFIYTGTYRPFRDALMSLCCHSTYRRRRQIEIEETFKPVYGC